MPSYHFNTLDMAKRLEAAGFSWEQASEIVRVIADTQIVAISISFCAATCQL